MYKLERAGVLEQAEITARAIDNQVVTLDTCLYILWRTLLMIRENTLLAPNKKGFVMAISSSIY